MRRSKSENSVLFVGTCSLTAALLVVVSDDVPPALRRSSRAYEALWGLSTSGDILVWTHTAFAERLHLRASLPSTVEREGRVLYSR